MKLAYWAVVAVYDVIGMFCKDPELLGPFETDDDCKLKVVGMTDQENIVSVYVFALPEGVEPLDGEGRVVGGDEEESEGDDF